ncbi:MAG: SemiSWEET transporter [Xanthobacteraceae bacterium]
MTATTLIGLAAATCTTVAYVPQVVKAWRSRSTKDVSLSMFLLMATGIILWLVYGAILRDLPLVLANGVTLGLAATILVFKLRFG